MIAINYKQFFGFQNRKKLNISSGKSNLINSGKGEYSFEGADSDVFKAIYKMYIDIKILLKHWSFNKIVLSIQAYEGIIKYNQSLTELKKS